MDDLRLWRDLRAWAADPASFPSGDEPRLTALVRDLGHMADHPLEERFTFFPALLALRGCPDARVRARILDMLSGATGRPALQALVEGFDDSHAEVRSAALVAFHRCARHDPDRWIHALFHPDPAVRDAALDLGPVRGAEWLTLFLAPELPDPAAALLAAGSAVLEPDLLPSLAGLVERGTIEPATVRAMFAVPGRRFPLALPRVLDWIPFDLAHAYLETFVTVSPEAPGDLPDLEGFRSHPLRWLVRMFQDASDAEAAWFHEGLTSTLADKIHGSTRPGVAAALVDQALAAGSWNPRALASCLSLRPRCLASERIPAEDRLEALRSMALRDKAHVIATQVEVRDLLSLPLFRSPSGSLRLLPAIPMLRGLDRPVDDLLRWFSAEEIATWALEDPEGGSRLLTLPRTSKGDVTRITAALRLLLFIDATRLLTVTRLLPAGSLDLLGNLGPSETFRLLGELRSFELERGALFSDAKLKGLARILLPALDGSGLATWLEAWLDGPRPESFSLGVEILTEITRSEGADRAAETMSRLPGPLLSRLFEALAHSPGVPWAFEEDLARRLAPRSEPTIRRWVGERASTAATAETDADRGKGERSVSAAECARLGSCAGDALGEAIAPFLERPGRGLCAALAVRGPAAPYLEVCVAVLAAADPPEEVGAAFVQFGSEEDHFLHELDGRMVSRWSHDPTIGMVGHAWLNRWEKHILGFADDLRAAGIGPTLAAVSRMASPGLRRVHWEMMGRLAGLWRWRGPDSVRLEFGEEALVPAIQALPRPEGEPAAAFLMTLHASGKCQTALESLRTVAYEVLPHCTDEVRRVLRDWIDSRGLEPRSRGDPPVDAALPERGEIEACADLSRLAAWCASAHVAAVDLAAARLLGLGVTGVTTLAGVLARIPPVRHSSRLVAAADLVPSGDPAKVWRPLVDDRNVDPEVRFRVGVLCFRRGDPSTAAGILEAVAAPSTRSWYGRSERTQLSELELPRETVAHALAVSPHPAAYEPALQYLLQRPAADDEAAASLSAFLACGDGRLRDLRSRVAVRLHERGEDTGWPIVAAHFLRIARGPRLSSHLPLDGVSPDLVPQAVDAFLAADFPGADPERLIEWLLSRRARREEGVEEGLTRLLLGSSDPGILQKILSNLTPGASRAAKLERIAKTFAWGVRRARELVGGMVKVRMLAGAELGFTRFGEAVIHVNVRPLLDGTAEGRTLVEGLILHELGHQKYHGGEEMQDVWKEAHKAGLGKLLNLVADEHLERNLRAVDGEFGDRFKRLATHAFMHLAREVAARTLVRSLGLEALPVLRPVRLGVGRSPGNVELTSGRVLRTLEERGSSFSRFVRGLRMGRGNRHRDPKVEQALALFGRTFKGSTPKQMLEITRQLLEIFREEESLLDVFEGHELLEPKAGDVLRETEGLTPGEIDEEVERILDPRRAAGPPGTTRRLWINVSNLEDFSKITQVVVLEPDPEQHRAVALEVARPARRLKRHLEELGFRWTPRPRRLSGRRVDTSRLEGLVTRGDPRILITRRREVRTDLFIGALIDCSGSMSMGGKLDRAKRFGVLLAEAVKDLPGVELRVFGFTDQVLYDAGSASRPAITALRTEGGNNDAAALFHVAEVALASRRRARLLVMVSDGLPTECSAAALRALVERLTRRHRICCAQVAVAKLAEICFPHHVDLEGVEEDQAVRAFGRTVGRLVRRVMGAG